METTKQARVNLEANDIRDLAQVVTGAKEGDFIITQPNATVNSVTKLLESTRPAPFRRKGDRSFATSKSFVDYVNEFKSVDSAIYLTRHFSVNSFEAQMVAVLNGNPNGEKMDEAAHEDFRALYDLPISEELQKWLESNQSMMGQAKFSQFLEDMLPSIALPADTDVSPVGSTKFAEPLTLLQLSRDLEVVTNEQFASAIRLSSGEQKLKFTQENKTSAGGKEIVMPEWFMIRLPIFDKGKLYNFAVRLRYRKSGTDLQFSYSLYRANDTFSQAIDEAAEEVQKATSLRLFYAA